MLNMIMLTMTMKTATVLIVNRNSENEILITKIHEAFEMSGFALKLNFRYAGLYSLPGYVYRGKTVVII